MCPDNFVTYVSGLSRMKSEVRPLGADSQSDSLSTERTRKRQNRGSQNSADFVRLLTFDF